MGGTGGGKRGLERSLALTPADLAKFTVKQIKTHLTTLGLAHLTLRGNKATWVGELATALKNSGAIHFQQASDEGEGSSCDQQEVGNIEVPGEAASVAAKVGPDPQSTTQQEDPSSVLAGPHIAEQSTPSRPAYISECPVKGKDTDIPPRAESIEHNEDISTLSVATSASTKPASPKIDSDQKEHNGVPSVGVLMFSTGLGKKLAISEDSLRRGAAILSSGNENHENHENHLQRPKLGISQAPETPGAANALFSTGSGRKLIVSEEALMRGAAKLGENKTTVEQVPPSVGLFSTGSGKNIAVSEEAMTRGSALLSDTNVEDSCAVKSIFSTGHGKTMTVNEAAMRRSAVLLAEPETEAAVNLHVPETPAATSGGEGGFDQRSLFCTGHGKKVAVTDKAMKRAAQLLSDSKEDGGSAPVGDMKVSKPMFGDGATGSIFSSGLGKSLAISEESMRKATALLSDKTRVPTEDTPSGTSQFGGHRSGSMTKFTPISMAPSSCGSTVLAPSTRSAAVDPKRLSFGSSALVTPMRALTHERPPQPPPRRNNQFRPPSKVSTSVSNPPRTNHFRRNGKRTLLDCKSIDAKRQAIASATPQAIAPTRKDPDIEPESTKSNRVSLAEMRDQAIRCFPEPPAARSEALANEIRMMTSHSAKSFVFRDAADLGAVALGGLSFSTIGPAEFHMLLLRSGASAKLLTLEWVACQYRWVIWKLAAYERRFPAQCQGALCVDEVLRQLQRKCQCEIVAGRRPILRRIAEKDTHAGVHMILMIADVNLDGDDASIELSDGWYSIPAKLDQGLLEQARKGRIIAGLKLRLCGSELTGLAEGTPILELPKTASLQLHFNGCQRASWDSKLGLQPSPSFKVALQSIRSDGGAVPCCDMMIQRHYPLRFLERLPMGGSVMRSEADEHKAASEHHEKAYQAMEKRREMLQQQGGDYEEMGVDVGFGEAFGQPTGVPQRDVRPLATFRVSDALYGDSCGRSRDDYRRTYVLSFWGGTEDTYGHMKDGSRHTAHFLNVRQARDGTVELSNKRETFFEEIKHRPVMQCFEPRRHTSFVALRQLALEDSFESTGMREVDIVGVLLAVVPEESIGAHTYFLMDEVEQLVAVRSWHSLVKNIAVGVGVCATSVEMKSHDVRHDVLHVHAGELSTFSLRPPTHLRETHATLMQWSQACPDAVKRNQLRVENLVAGKSTGAVTATPGLATPAPGTQAQRPSQPMAHAARDSSKMVTVCAFGDLRIQQSVEDPASSPVGEALPVAYFDPDVVHLSQGAASRGCRLLVNVREDFSTRRAWVPGVSICEALRRDKCALEAVRRWLHEVASVGSRATLAQRLQLRELCLPESLLVALSFSSIADPSEHDGAARSRLHFSVQEWAAFAKLLSRHLEGTYINIDAVTFVAKSTVASGFDDEFGSGSQLFALLTSP